MGCTMTEVSDDELAEACREICPGAYRFAVRRWTIPGCSAESTVAMMACYTIGHRPQWKEIATARDERRLLAVLLTSDPHPEPWKSNNE